MDELNIVPGANVGRRGFLRTAALASAGGMLYEAVASASPRNARGDYAVSARLFGALGDGKHDDTDSIQKALNQAAKMGGGIVVLPAGKYLIAGTLTIPEQVVLEGIARGPISHTGLGHRNAHAHVHPSAADKLTTGENPPRVNTPATPTAAIPLTAPDPLVPGEPAAMPGAGTTLLAVGQRGKEDGTPLITMGTDSALRGLSIWYPHQNRDKTPVPYPWTVRMHGDNVTVEDVELLNPWRGINADQTQRHFISNVTGNPLRVGIFLDRVYDIGRIQNVQFNLWWCHNRSISEFVYRHGEAFIFGRSDWEYVFNTFSYGYHIGYRFIQGKTGACNGNFLGIGADGSWQAVRVDQSQAWVNPDQKNRIISPGLLITNGEFVSLNHLDLPGKVDPIQVVVSAGNFGTVRFSNCSFWGPSHHIAQLAGTGTVGFSGCTFAQWNRDASAIHADCRRVIINGCEFQQEGRQVAIGKAVRQAVISGNMFAGPEHITNASTGNVQIGLNSAE